MSEYKRQDVRLGPRYDVRHYRRNVFDVEEVTDAAGEVWLRGTVKFKDELVEVVSVKLAPRSSSRGRMWLATYMSRFAPAEEENTNHGA